MYLYVAPKYWTEISPTTTTTTTTTSNEAKKGFVSIKRLFSFNPDST